MGKRSVLQQFSLNYDLFGVLHASAKEITLFLSNEFLSQLFTKVTSNNLMPTQAFSRGCSRAAAPVCGFSRGTMARSVSLSWGAGKSGLHASGEGERVIAPEPWEGTLASRRVEEGLSRSFPG